MIRLLDLRKEKNASQRQMAAAFNVSQGTYNNWEQGNTQPSIEQLIELAKFFKVSVDYLIGNSDEEGYIKVQNSLTDDEISTLARFNKLSDESKKHLLNFLSSLDR